MGAMQQGIFLCIFALATGTSSTNLIRTVYRTKQPASSAEATYVPVPVVDLTNVESQPSTAQVAASATEPQLPSSSNTQVLAQPVMQAAELAPAPQVALTQDAVLASAEQLLQSFPVLPSAPQAAVLAPAPQVH